MKRRSHQGGSDVELLQAFNTAATAETAGCGYVHPGDLPHRLFNGNKLFDPREVITIWEDDEGVAAWVLVGPRHRGYDAQVRPDLRGIGFEREVLRYAEDLSVELMRRHGIEGDRILCEAYRCDTTRVDLLTELGRGPDGEALCGGNRAALVDLAEPVIPEGYAIRAVRGLDEAPRWPRFMRPPSDRTGRPRRIGG